MKKALHNLVGTRNNILLAENIRTLYLQGKSYEYICQTLNITKNTINSHRKRALKEGDDWDALLLIHKRNKQHIGMSEAYFVNALIAGFEAQILHNEQLSLPELAKYTKLYFQLKAPKNNDELRAKELAHANTQRVLRVIAKLAMDMQAEEVVEFLSAHADAIIKEVFKKDWAQVFCVQRAKKALHIICKESKWDKKTIYILVGGVCTSPR